MSNQVRYCPHIQLVPSPLWGVNMRKLIPQKLWSELRKGLFDRQGMQCATCGKTESDSRKLSAHEAWFYDESAEPSVARLITVSLVCWHCHAIEHWGVTKNLIDQGHLADRALYDAIEHFCRVNGVEEADFHAHEKDARRTWLRRSQKQWQVDYGPFLGWAVAKFVRDPLNDADWSEEAVAAWNGSPPVSMNTIVSGLPSSEIAKAA